MLQLKVKVDHLEGLKENVIVGRLVPAGTGLTKMGWDKEAKKEDQLRLEELEKTRARNCLTSRIISIFNTNFTQKTLTFPTSMLV